MLAYHHGVSSRANPRHLPRVAAACLFLVALVLSQGCKQLAQRYWLMKYDRQAEAASRAYERAKSDGERASRLAERGRAYSDKGRYSRFAHCIGLVDYEQLFARAMRDHDLAVTLAPGQSDVYLLRGWSYYDRAVVLRLDTLESISGEEGWLRRAQNDFTRAMELDPRNVMAWDMRALIRAALGDRDGVVADLTASTKIAPAGKARLADAYCDRGGFRHRQKDFAGAAADYEESVALGASADGCSCDPHAPLVAVYTDELHAYDNAWKVVRRARANHRWLPPELVTKLSKASGRTE
jgi:tetratricopeptide (TPR) repeat protein